MATFAELNKYYLAYFGRPVDYLGAREWADNTAAEVEAAFAASKESQALYAATDLANFVNSVYVNVIGRDAELNGLNYWVNKILTGAVTKAGAAIAILNDALLTGDKTSVQNKLDAAEAFYQAIDTAAEATAYSGDAAAASARAFIAGITATPATAAEVEAALADVGTASEGGGGQPFTLTTNADSVTGTSGNDTFNGTNTTLQATDVIRGGAGRDTLNYTDASAGGTNLPVADIAGIEVINVRNVGQGVTTPGQTETATVTFTALAAGQTVILGTVAGTVTYTQGVTGTGTVAELAAFFAANAPTGFTVTGATASTVTFTSTTAKSNVADLTNTGTNTAQVVAITQGSADVVGAVATNTFSAANLIGAQEFNTVNSIGAVTVTNLAAGQSLGMVGNGATTVGALTGTYGATVTSTTLNLKDGLQTTTVAGAPVGAGAVVINGAALATATVNSTGAANAVADLDFAGGAALTTLNINATSNFGLAAGGSISGFSAGATSTINVTGSGAVRVNALDAALDVYNASTATGAQTLTLGAATQQVTLGSGNDVVTTGGIGLTTGSVAAGAGTADRLVLTASADINTLAEGARYSGFEQVQIENNQALDLDLLAANNTIDTIRLNNAAGTAQVTNLNATQAANVQIVNAAAGLITIGVKNANDGGQIDTVKAALTTTTAAGAAQNINLATAPISLSGVEKLELTGNGTVAATTGTVTLNTAAAISLDSIKLANAGNGNIITIAAGHAATNLVVDASASTGNTTIDAGLYATLTGATLKGGSGNDVLIGSVRVDSLSGGNGRDLFDFDTDAGVGLSRSTAAATDKIADFGKITTAVSDVTGLTLLTFQNAGEVRGGANADVIDLSNVAAARATVVATATDVAAASGNAALDIKATLDARGLLTLTGADAAEINTVAEVLAVFNGLNGVAGGAGVFNLNGNAIVIQENAAGVNAVVELTGVTLTGVSIIGVAGTGLVGEAFII